MLHLQKFYFDIFDKFCNTVTKLFLKHVQYSMYILDAFLHRHKRILADCRPPLSARSPLSAFMSVGPTTPAGWSPATAATRPSMQISSGLPWSGREPPVRRTAPSAFWPLATTQPGVGSIWPACRMSYLLQRSGRWS